MFGGRGGAGGGATQAQGSEKDGGGLHVEISLKTVPEVKMSPELKIIKLIGGNEQYLMLPVTWLHNAVTYDYNLLVRERNGLA
jgi:hypothetical protein